MLHVAHLRVFHSGYTLAQILSPYCHSEKCILMLAKIDLSYKMIVTTLRVSEQVQVCLAINAPLEM